MSGDHESLRALAKIDCHHHLWDLSMGCHPWLTPSEPPRMYGDHSAICKDYLIDDFLADCRPHNVVKSVHVQANWDATRPVEETRWVQSIADVHGYPHAIVAYADLSAPDLDSVLEAHLDCANTRGIRQIIGHTDDPDGLRRDRPDLLHSSAFERGFARLARHGLSFDLQAFPRQMLDFTAIAARYPDVPVVLVHTGFPWDRSEAGIGQWREGIAALAALPRSFVKLSGPGMVMPHWTPEAFAPFIHESIERFGPARCMFASNVPPDALNKSYDQIYRGFYRWASRYSESEQRQLFHDTAAALYRI